MAELTRTFRWQRYVPDIGNNRELEKPFYLEVAIGLTKAQLADLLQASKEMNAKAYVDGPEGVTAAVEDLSKLLGPFVRLGKEPLNVEGKVITDMRGYLELCAGMPNLMNALEVTMAVRFCNQLGGPQELFFERLSGGFSSTPERSGEKGTNPGAAH